MLELQWKQIWSWLQMPKWFLRGQCFSELPSLCICLLHLHKLCQPVLNLQRQQNRHPFMSMSKRVLWWWNFGALLKMLSFLLDVLIWSCMRDLCSQQNQRSHMLMPYQFSLIYWHALLFKLSDWSGKGQDVWWLSYYNNWFPVYCDTKSGNYPLRRQLHS